MAKARKGRTSGLYYGTVRLQYFTNDLLFKLGEGDRSKIFNYAGDNSLLSIGATVDPVLQK